MVSFIYRLKQCNPEAISINFPNVKAPQGARGRPFTRPRAWKMVRLSNGKWQRNMTYNLPRCFKYTSSTAQGGGGSFKNRKPIGGVSCCESRMAERIHWWTERWLRSPHFLSHSLSMIIYLPTYRSIYLSICLSFYLSVYLSVSLSSVYLTIYPSIHPSI